MPDDRAIETVVGERLRTLRLRRGLTQRALARQVSGGVDLSYISRIERGEQIPSLKVLQKLSRALDVPLREFFAPELTRRPEGPRQAYQALWRRLQKVSPEDLPILSAIISALTRQRGEKTGYSVSNLGRRVAAERKRQYRAGTRPRRLAQ